ncbi:unannotated protein [freshwater metagenome]|uniref:Unannotated protein n=1 Tax=freshwater metagenome TaxID=449393 RepID=A0A6J6PIP8_9ZZZZ
MQSGLTDLVGAINDVPALAAVLVNPQTETSSKSEILVDVVGDGEELLTNFVRVLAEKGRTGEIREIAAEYDTLVAQLDRVLDVELTTAYELSEQDFTGILSQIEKASGRKVKATRSVDPDLIGGIVLQAGSMRVDASVRGRLERLRHDLAGAR